MRSLVRLAAIASLACAAACGGGGDGGGSSPAAGQPLSAAEHASMTNALAKVFAGARPGSFALGPGLTLRQTVPCPNGGTSTYTGSYSIDLIPPRIRMALSHAMDGCRSPGSDGTIWTFDTDRPTTMTIDWRTAPGVDIVALTLFGAVETTDGSGQPVPSCDVDLAIDAQFFDDGRVSLRMRGMLCDVPTDVVLNLP